MTVSAFFVLRNVFEKDATGLHYAQDTLEILTFIERRTNTSRISQWQLKTSPTLNFTGPSHYLWE